jgi:signal transduction histidine kinase
MPQSPVVRQPARIETPPSRASRRVGKLFGNLKVRPKLMVLHNLFFLVLSVSVYLVLYPDLGHRAAVNLVIILATVYILAVLLLEIAIIPLYVYGPLRQMLDADLATQHGDREHEIIDDDLILGDEIGQIMRSRNATILQLRKHEEALEDALRKLEAQDRLVSLGLLSTSVAHELNTPLSVLQGSIEKLIETTTDRAALDRLERMLRVTQRLRKISEGLVDFARARKDVMESVALRPLIDESWSLVAIDEKASQASFDNNVAEHHAVQGNADRLIQVFLNLLRNALYAIQPGGKIVVQSKDLLRNEQRWISVKVEDDGPGIPPEVLPEIFEAFVSTRLDARGTGLGLTVAEGIIHQHGGTISATNRAGSGACIEVTLVAAAALGPPPARTPETVCLKSV